MLKVFVSTGKQMPTDKAVVEDAELVARLLAKYGCTMVQTGAKLGLMGIVVEEFEKYSDEMFMITPKQFRSDLEKHSCKQHIEIEFETDRMKEAIKNFDLAVILPGGMGTFAELAYFNEVCKSGESNAKIVIVNSKGYYNKLLKFFKHQMKLGFTNQDSIRFDVVKNSQGFETILQQMIADRQNELYQESLNLIKLKSAEADTAVESVESKPKQTTNKSSGVRTRKSTAKRATSSSKAKSTSRVSGATKTAKTSRTSKAKTSQTTEKKRGRPAKKSADTNK